MPKIFTQSEIRKLVKSFPDFPSTINRFNNQRINTIVEQQGFENVGEFTTFWKNQLKEAKRERKNEKKRQDYLKKKQEEEKKRVEARKLLEKKEQQRKQRNEKARKRYAQKQEEKRKEQERKEYEENKDKKFFIRFEIKYKAQYKDTKTGRPHNKIYDKMTPVDIVMDFQEYKKYKNDTQAYDLDVVAKFEDEMEHVSPIHNINVQDVKTSIQVMDASTNLQSIKMRDTYALTIAGEEQPWDTKTGRCVFDFIIWRYGKVNGFKKVCTYEKLNEVFIDYLDSKTTQTQTGEYAIKTENPLEEGVDCYNIANFCRKFNVPMYALDEDNKHFDVFLPEKRNKDAPSLVFKVLNNHFYPVIEKSDVYKYTQAINNTIKCNVSSSVISNVDIENVNERVSGDMLRNAEILEDVIFPDAVLFNAIKEHQTLPNCIKQMKMQDNNITQFSIVNKETKEAKNYVINQNVDKLYQMVEAMGLPFENQSIHTILFNIIKDLNVTIPMSCPNPHVYDTLTLKGVKDRTHYGCVNGFNADDVMKAYNEGIAQCADIAKCHTACLYEPMDDWIVLDFNDEWEEWLGVYGEFPRGLYSVITDDTSLFTGSNIYSNSMLDFAYAEGIPFKVQKYLKASFHADRTLFKPILDAIKSHCKEDKETMKLMNNILSGYLAKHFKTHTIGRINSDINQAWTWIQKNAIECGDKPFLRPLCDEEGNKDLHGQTYYLYGKTIKTIVSENNIPMYIQMKDYSNIRLYNMIKEMGGTLAFRKVDCAIVINGNFKPTSEEWGGWRTAEPPKKLGAQKEREAVVVDNAKDWINYDIKDSSNWEDVFKIAIEKHGMLIQSRAGTGKTFAGKNIAKQLKKNGHVIRKIAFTNKACLMLKGKTIHKFLKMNKENKIPMTALKNMRDNHKIEFIIVDEISMIPKFLWKRLVEVKRFLGATFILLGDHRQCPPVENNETEVDYFNHPAVKYLANYNRVEFTVMKRYDKELWDMLEDVDGLSLCQFGQKLKRRSISYTNKTRKWVNHYWMNKEKPNDGKYLFIPHIMTNDEQAMFVEHDEVMESEETKPVDVDEYPQDVYIYDGLPVIARNTIEGGKYTVSNEFYTVKSFDESTGDIVVSCTRTGSPEDFEEDAPEKDEDIEEQEYEHDIIVNINNFHDNFLVNYCSTVHKSQGETIYDDFTILDWEKMSTKIRYTALSRAKTPKQINFVHLVDYNMLLAKSDDYNEYYLNKIYSLYSHTKPRILRY